MLSTDRKFHFRGELIIKRSKVLDKSYEPEDDEVNWLFLVIDNARYSFVYKIEENQNVSYNLPFKILLAFTFYEFVENEVNFHKDYTVQRGEENIGTVILLEKI